MSKPQLQSVIRTASLILVAIVVAWTLYITGGPGLNRQLRTDEQQLQRLVDTSRAIEKFFDQKNELPATLEDIRTAAQEKPNGLHYEYQPFMEAIKKSDYGITYERKDDTHYSLCTEFLRDWEEGGDVYQPYRINNVEKDMWKYKAGKHCFAREIKKKKT